MYFFFLQLMSEINTDIYTLSAKTTAGKADRPALKADTLAENITGLSKDGSQG